MLRWLHRGFFLSFVFLLASCGGVALQASQPSIALFKYVGSEQCGEPLMTAANLQDTVAILKRQGVAVLSAQCGSDGRMYPAVCGAGTGEVWIVSVAANDEARAVAAGFVRVVSDEMVAVPCRE